MTEQPRHPVEWLPELALGVLAEEDANPVRAHLEGCDECQREYNEVTRVARLLPYAAEDEAPDSDGRERLMQRIRTEPRETATIIRPWRPWSWAGSLAAAAAVVVLVGIGGFVLGQQTAEDDLQDIVDRQQSIVLAAARGTLDVSHGGSDSARVSLVRSPVDRSSFALVEGLPSLPQGRAYQAWFTEDGETFEPSDVFQVSNGGVWLFTREAMENYAAMAFTIEDEQGADAPTQDPFVVIPLSPSLASR